MTQLNGTDMTEADYYQAMRALEKLLPIEPRPGSLASELLAELAHAIEEYEQLHFPISKPTNEEIEEFRAEQEGRPHLPRILRTLEASPENIELVAKLIFLETFEVHRDEADREADWNDTDSQNPETTDLYRQAARIVLQGLRTEAGLAHVGKGEKL